jgi:preprotein translocase subunit SecF
MNIIRNKKIFLSISVVLVIISLAVVVVRGLDYGIEFTGGSLLEVSYEERPDVDDLKQSITEAGFEGAQVQAAGDNGYIVKTGPLSEEDRKALIAAASPEGEELAVASVERFNSIGPSVGKELRTKSLYALILVSLGIVFFVAYAFRKVSRPVSSWKYGLVAVVALLHDIIIPVGILTLLGTEIDTLYVVGLLSILGLSVNDTIVVFDRIRENLQYNNDKSIAEEFDVTVGEAIKQTITRSIFTSLTLVVVLLALYLVGPAATQTLALVLLLGTLVGTYSSIFLASPLLTTLVSKNKDA